MTGLLHRARLVFHGLALTAVSLYYGLQRILDGRTREMTRRIDAVHEGQARFDHGRYAVFVYHDAHAVSSSVTTALAALRAHRVNVVVVANMVGASARPQLIAACHTLIERANVGRDFGGYKDGIAHIYARMEPDRLLLLNDSTFWLAEKAEAFIGRMLSEGDFVAATETHERHYHVGSFALSFSAAVCADKAFVSFWSAYRLSNSRRHAIHNGEVALTRSLMAAGWMPRVLYTTAALRTHLAAMSAEQVIVAASLLPSAMPTIAQTMTSVRAACISDLDTANPLLQRAALSLGGPGAIAAERILFAITSINQMHGGGLLFAAYLGMPLVKRDLVYRGVYTLDHLESCLHYLRWPETDDLMADVRRRGTAGQLHGSRKLLYRLSFR